MHTGKPLRCAGISMVRNEADIIEWWARYNLRCLDSLHIADHHSCDNTVEILRSLQSEGLPIFIQSFEDVRHLQTEAMHQLALPLAAGGLADFLVPLDADELLAVDRDGLHRALRNLPAGTAGAMPWRTYLPKELDAEACYFRRCTSYRSKELESLCKLIVPASIYNEQTRWGAGNHSFYNLHSGEMASAVHLGFVLAHYPVRDLEQLQRKIFTGAMASRLKQHRHPGESWHWLQLEAYLEQHLRDGTTPDLGHIATSYSYSSVSLRSSQEIHTGGIDPYPEIQCIYEAKPLNLEQVQAYISELRGLYAKQLETAGYTQFNAGNQAYGNNAFSLACQYYSDAIFLNSSLHLAHLGRARSLACLGQHQEACEEFKQLLESQPNNYSGLLEYGHALRKLRRRDEAAAAYLKAISVAPNRFEAHLGLGRLLQEQGNVQAGQLHYQRAIQAAFASDQSGHQSNTNLDLVKNKIREYQLEIGSAQRGQQEPRNE